MLGHFCRCSVDMVFVDMVFIGKPCANPIQKCQTWPPWITDRFERPRVELLTRGICTICQRVHERLGRIGRRIDFDLTSTDVDVAAAAGDTALRSEFGDRLPGGTARRPGTQLPGTSMNCGCARICAQNNMRSRIWRAWLRTTYLGRKFLRTTRRQVPDTDRGAGQ